MIYLIDQQKMKSFRVSYNEIRPFKLNPIHGLGIVKLNGEKGEPWTEEKLSASNNMKLMKIGDLGFFTIQ